MNTWLYLTAEGLDDATVDWPCCVWTSTGERQRLPLNQAAQALDGQAVDVLLPMELCSWVRSDAWPSRRRPGAAAIEFAVEEQLSEPLERLHLSIGVRDREGRFGVMVISRERFAHVLALLADATIEVRAVYVDADVLHGAEPAAIRWFGRSLLGGGVSARLAVHDDGLALLEPALPADLRWIEEIQEAGPGDQPLSLRPPHAVNLLQGQFAPRRKSLPWHLAGFTVLLMVFLTWGANLSRVHFLESETRRLHTHNEQRFKALYPDQQRIVDLAAQLKQRQSAEPPATRMASLVNLIEQVIGASPVEVRRIEFRAGEGWKIQLTANSFAEIEQLRERGRQQGVTLRLDNASKERDRVRTTLTVEDNS